MLIIYHSHSHFLTAWEILLELKFALQSNFHNPQLFVQLQLSSRKISTSRFDVTLTVIGAINFVVYFTARANLSVVR